MSQVYVVDDDVQMAELLKVAIEGFGMPVTVFNQAQEFLEVSLKHSDIILLDLNMPDIDGIEVIRTLANASCNARLVLISGHDVGVLHSAEQLAQAHALKISASMTKPIRIKQLQELMVELSVESPVVPDTVHSNHLQPELDELHEAIYRREFILHYQPQIDIASGQLSGVEALVRWNHPSRGLVYPDLFIGMAEQYNLIGELTEQILQLSIEQCRQWRSMGLQIPIALNISAENIKGLTLPEHLFELLKANQLDPGNITLEVTESALMGELVTSLDILTRLRMKGFSLSIDDFGTGYSSLSQLHRIPFTELKIDKSFIMSMLNDVESRAIVKTCIMLGHELNMNVVAEGVETAEIYNELKSLGCDIAQGYHIARPMPAEEIAAWKVSWFQAS